MFGSDPSAVLQCQQNLPLLISLMELAHDQGSCEEVNSPAEASVKHSALCILLASLLVHNPDPSFDVLLLLERNVGLGVLTSSILQFTTSIPHSTQAKNEAEKIM